MGGTEAGPVCPTGCPTNQADAGGAVLCATDVDGGGSGGVADEAGVIVPNFGDAGFGILPTLPTFASYHFSKVVSWVMFRALRADMYATCMAAMTFLMVAFIRGRVFCWV